MSETRLNRRAVLAGSGALAAGLAGTMLPGVAFAEPGGARERTRTVTGTLPPDVPDWYYLPVDVPRGVREIEVSYRYDKPDVPQGEVGNALDIGIFSPAGHQPDHGRGFRGWSGGFRDTFTISASDATPGYLPGPIQRGRWHVILGPYTVAQQGLNYEVDITLRFGEPGPDFVPSPAPDSAPAADRGRAWYRGDGHLHTVHSDGRRTPAELVADARAAGLDFIVSTEHNTSSAALRWGDHATDDLLILNGEEVTTRSGHWTAWNLAADTWLDWRYRSDEPRRFRHLVRRVHRDGGLVAAAHPFAPCFGCPWEFGYEHADLVEVWNGPWTPDDEAAVTAWDGQLRVGNWVPAVGNSDAHNPDQTVGLPHNVVLADGLRPDRLMDGFRAGRTWIAESTAVTLRMAASAGSRSAGIGGMLTAGTGTPITVEVSVDGVPDTELRMYDQNGPRWRERVDAGGTATVRWTTQSRYSRWVRLEVRRAESDAMVALTNPIFLSPG